MLLLADVRDWIKTLKTDAENFYCGRLDNKKEKSIGVYQLKSDTRRTVLGGLDNLVFEIKAVSILIHWNKNSRETEISALNLYEQIRQSVRFYINDTYIYFIEMLQGEPVDVSSDDNGVYERVIELKIYYRRK